MRKTKIICTIGPSSESEENLRKLMLAGMNVARMNFSHGSFEEHGAKIVKIKKLREELGLHTALLLDTKGPEIRTLDFEGGIVTLDEGQKFEIRFDDSIGSKNGCAITYKELYKDVKSGDRILIDDGLISLVIDAVSSDKIDCTVENAGTIKNKRGVNVPGVKVNLPALTEKDKGDILLGIEQGVDFLAVSFVRKAADIIAVREFLKQNGGQSMFVISKIENQEGVDNIDEIIDVSDGIMVARGDLGVEIPEEQIPVVQKNIIKKCNAVGKVVVTATQMLDSMIRNPRPTRAEVTDVANAVLDGTDAIMLSGETASGDYPIESFETMKRIAVKAEAALDYEHIRQRSLSRKQKKATDAIGHCTCLAAADVDADAILTTTHSGKTTFIVAKFRPEAPIVALTYSDIVARKLSICWGAMPFVIKEASHQYEVFGRAIDMAKQNGVVKDGDCVVITAGVPLAKGANTNLMRIHTIGEDLV